jgi:hypothetical protein
MEAIVAQSATTVVEMPRNTSPLPTDSMVTVRLSDAQIHPVSNDSVRNSRRRSSSANSHSSSISAISSTRSSTPSNTTVDWEELEKTEEQEPRDQATDEVCLRSPTNYVTSINADTSPPPSSWLAWNERMLHWWETPNLALFLLPGLNVTLAPHPSNT